MKYCENCVMPETRPGLKFNNGVCIACENYKNRENIDWDNRWGKLEDICDDHRRDDGYYDCVIPVSGGKDSHFQVHLMKEKLNMTPLLVAVSDPFSKTSAGKENLANLQDTFDCDLITFDISYDTFREATRIGFEQLGEPLKFVETAIYNQPIKIADRFDIPLLIYGENPAYEYGTEQSERMSADEHIDDMIEKSDISFWENQDKLSKQDLNPIRPPEQSVTDRIESIFLSYFTPWNGYKNLKTARKYGFKTVEEEWNRPGHIESYDQIDSIAYIVHNWMKYPKFGFARSTDIASRWIRWGVISREEAKRLVMERDGKLDQRALDDFCEFCNYTRNEFWDIAESHYNEEIFSKNEFEEWELDNPVYSDIEIGRSKAAGLDGVSGL